MANIYTNQWNAHVVACESHAAEILRHVYGDVRQVGTTDEECRACRTARQLAEQPARMRAALMSPKLSHTRTKYGSVHAYHRDDASPSGVMLAASLDEARYADLARELAGVVFGGCLAPLSPTEGLAVPR
jgi:hypothetical protein